MVARPAHAATMAQTVRMLTRAIEKERVAVRRKRKPTTSEHASTVFTAETSSSYGSEKR